MRRRILYATLALSVSAVPMLAQTPVNDEPAGAIVVGSGQNPGGSSLFDNFGATTTTSPPGPTCTSTNTHSDVWFYFTPTTTGPHVVNTCNPAGATPGSNPDTTLAVYDPSFVQLACDDDGCQVNNHIGASYLSQTVVALTAGSPVYIRVGSWTSGTTVSPQGSFHLNILDPAIPAGGTCATATVISDGVHFANFFGATASGFTGGGVCANFTATTVDLYYLYFPPISGTCVAFLEGLGTARIAAYDFSSATCGSETLVAGSCVAVRNVAFPVNAGTPYLVRVGLTAAAASDAAGCQMFSIGTTPSGPPGNDVCSGATFLAPGNNPISTVGATPEPAVVACTGFTPATNNDVWGLYVSTSPARVTLTIGGFNAQQAAVYTGACGALTPVVCTTQSTTIFNTSFVSLGGGTLYYIRAGTITAANRALGNIHVVETPLPPNDECAGAVPISVGLNGPFTNAAASTSAGLPTCMTSTTAFNDVWYAFTAPISGTVKFSGCNSTSDPYFALYSSCGGTQIACDDDDLLNLGPCATTQTLNPFLQTAVVAGSTYYLRVGNNTATDTTFFVNVEYEFSLTLSYNGGTGIVTIADVAGNPGHLALNAITLTQGAFPNGWFYGVDIPVAELFYEYSLGAPFFVLLDGSGGFSASYGPLPPLGVTFYGVGVVFSPAGIYVKKSAPVSVFI